MRFYTINKDYIDYLKEFDNKVPNVEYQGRLKLFAGKIKLQNNNESIGYYIPLTSLKDKFEPINETFDIYKIMDNKRESYTSVLNINNMIPVPDIAVTEFSYDMLRNNESFKTLSEKDKYYHLVIDELNYINENKDIIEYNAKTIFSMVNDNNKNYQQLADRCCNFVDLFEHAIEFNDIITSEVEDLMSKTSAKFKELGIGNNNYSNSNSKMQKDNYK